MDRQPPLSRLPGEVGTHHLLPSVWVNSFRSEKRASTKWTGGAMVSTDSWFVKAKAFLRFSIGDKDLQRPVGPRANREGRVVRVHEGSPLWLHHVHASLWLHSDPGWGGKLRQSPSIRFRALFTRSALASELRWEVILLPPESARPARAPVTRTCARRGANKQGREESGPLPRWEIR